MNLFAEQAELEKKSREQSKVVPIPTRYNAEALRKEGKVIVMRPTKPNNDLPPAA